MKERALSAFLMLSCMLAASACPSSKSSSADTNTAGTGADSDAAVPEPTDNVLHGKLGALGTIKPSVSAVVINNSGETLVYLSTDKLTCAQVMVSRWLGDVAVGAQVIEIVAKNDLTSGTQKVGDVEINFAPGGKSSAYEESATSGTVTFTSCALGKACAGTINKAACDGGACSVDGPFNAEFCDGGQGY